MKQVTVKAKFPLFYLSLHNAIMRFWPNNSVQCNIQSAVYSEKADVNY